MFVAIHENQETIKVIHSESSKCFNMIVAYVFFYKNKNCLIKQRKNALKYNLQLNVLFTLNRTTHSSETLLRVERFNVNKTLLSSMAFRMFPNL